MTIAALHALLDEKQPEVPHLTARKRKTMNQPPVPAPRPAQEAPSADEAPLPVGQLLAWAIAHPTKGVARKGVQVRELLAQLRTVRAEAERMAQAEAEEQRLLRQLEAVRARKEQLRARKKPTPGVDQAAVREWARANGHDVPARGRVPAPVVQAWHEATGGAR